MKWRCLARFKKKNTNFSSPVIVSLYCQEAFLLDIHIFFLSSFLNFYYLAMDLCYDGRFWCTISFRHSWLCHSHMGHRAFCLNTLMKLIPDGLEFFWLETSSSHVTTSTWSPLMDRVQPSCRRVINASVSGVKHCSSSMRTDYSHGTWSWWQFMFSFSFLWFYSFLLFTIILLYYSVSVVNVNCIRLSWKHFVDKFVA